MKINYPESLFSRAAVASGSLFYRHKCVNLVSIQGDIYCFNIVNDEYKFSYTIEITIISDQFKKYSIRPTEGKYSLAAVYACIEFLKYYGQKDETTDLPNRIKFIYNALKNTYGINFEDNKDEFIKEVILSLTEEELNDKYNTALLFYKILLRNRMYNANESISVTLKFINNIKLDNDSLTKIVKIFAHEKFVSLSYYGNSLDYFLDDLFFILDKDYRFNVSQGVADEFVSFYKSGSSYSYALCQFLKTICSHFIDNGVLFEDFVIFIFTHTDLMESNRLTSDIINYAFEHEFINALRFFPKNLYNGLDKDAKKGYVAFLIEIDDKVQGYSFANSLVSSSCTFIDYVWYKELDVPSEYALSDDLLYEFAINNKFKGAYLVYNHKQITVSVLKSISLEDFKIVENILLSEYKALTIEALKVVIEQKIYLKNVNEQQVVSYLFTLKKFSLTEYGKLRNNPKIKQIIGRSASFRYDDVMTLMKTHQLEMHKLYKFKG